MISHHILCAGTAGAAFARASARCIRLAAGLAEGTMAQTLPPIYIHLDGLPHGAAGDLCSWLSEEPGVHPTHGLTGLGPCSPRRQHKLINGHQRMINAICGQYVFEPAIAFADADLFLTDARWFEHLKLFAKNQPPFALTWGLRTDRILSPGDGTAFMAMKTNLFALRPDLHNAFNLQRSNTDRRAVESLRREFPAATIQLGVGLDTMVAVSLRAQAHGYRLVDVEKSIGACHIGGFSHLDPRKLRGGGSGVPTERWLRRLRLMESVLQLFDALGWGERVDPALASRCSAMRALVKTDRILSEQIETLKPNADERAFGAVSALLQP